ncbi:hypothetical protein [uncultured Brevundimonas sp.]|uniref:hypothetical protein n=1 Tax=uncultured Brevundimonas sp. TaxID=213418 RepID=UPI0030EBF820|tara:strand:+ start:15828 stop:16097 length:270 start_codon:yes stop_codon:yes gene_type:complete
MQTTNETRRSVMKIAWSLFREAMTAGDPRSFADALAGAWRWIKKLAMMKRPNWSRGGGIARSAIGRRYGAAAYIGGRSSVAYLAARVGS